MTATNAGARCARSGYWQGAAVAMSALTVLALTGCNGSQPARHSVAPSGKDDPGFEHVHGLGINPGEDAVYVATHTGVFRVPTMAGQLTVSGPAERVGGHWQDTMAFVVGGRNLFYGSGHPDLMEQPALRPPLLGLIASSDNAQTWRSVSLRGQVDFHAMDVADSGRRILGYDSATSRMMLSTDSGRSWSDGAVGDFLDLGMDPTKPAVVLATTRTGLTRSTDGGATFSLVPGAPLLMFVDYAPAVPGGTAAAWGIDGRGQVWSSPTPATGGSWNWRGQLNGSPEALAVSATSTGVRLLAADGVRVVTSSDGGRTWSVLLDYPGSADVMH